MSGCCCSVENWSVASQTSQFLPGPDGRLWKPRADHSQSQCRLETAACRLRGGRRQEEEDQPHAKEQNRREKTQKERQKIKIKVLHPCRIHFISPSYVTRQYKQDKTNIAKLSALAAVFVLNCFSLYRTDFEGLFCNADKEFINQNTCKQKINANDIKIKLCKENNNASVSC